MEYPYVQACGGRHAVDMSLQAKRRAHAGLSVTWVLCKRELCDKARGRNVKVTRSLLILFPVNEGTSPACIRSRGTEARTLCRWGSNGTICYSTRLIPNRKGVRLVSRSAVSLARRGSVRVFYILFYHYRKVAENPTVMTVMMTVIRTLPNGL